MEQPAADGSVTESDSDNPPDDNRLPLTFEYVVDAPPSKMLIYPS